MFYMILLLGEWKANERNEKKMRKNVQINKLKEKKTKNLLDVYDVTFATSAQCTATE